MGSFKRIYDALSRQKQIERAFKSAIEMLKRDEYMFNEVCNAIIEGEVLRHGKVKKSDIVKVLSKEDLKINEMEAEIRRGIFEYLVLNTSPDIGTALTLTSIVIDLERLGDYTKDLAKLTLLKPLKLTKGKYIESIKDWRNTMLDMFKLTREALSEDDAEKARKVMDLNKQFRDDTDKILFELDSDETISGREAILYTLFTRYFRRVSGHLENIATSVTKPFPYLGFKDIHVNIKR